MDSKMGNFFDSIGSFFSGGDKIPWCDREVILVSLLSLDLVKRTKSRFDLWVISHNLFDFSMIDRKTLNRI